MYMHTYGEPSYPAAVLLHPMGITAEKLYEIVGQKLKGSYCLLIPDMGNHGKEKADFLSVEDEAENICKYLESHGVTELAIRARSRSLSSSAKTLTGICINPLRIILNFVRILSLTYLTRDVNRLVS